MNTNTTAPAGVVSSTELGERTSYEKPAHGWTCFHCGETFTTVGSARDHFGAAPDAQPGCVVRVSLGAERGLLMALRKAEEECRKAWDAVQGESTEAHRAMYAMQSRHNDALEQAEISGYERGLIDGRQEQAMQDIADQAQELGLYDATAPDVLYVYRYEDGRTAVRAPGLDDEFLVRDMLSEAIRAMDEGQPVLSH